MILTVCRDVRPLLRFCVTAMIVGRFGEISALKHCW